LGNSAAAPTVRARILQAACLIGIAMTFLLPIEHNNPKALVRGGMLPSAIDSMHDASDGRQPGTGRALSVSAPELPTREKLPPTSFGPPAERVRPMAAARQEEVQWP
jgi:hypothetical protein